MRLSAEQIVVKPENGFISDLFAQNSFIRARQDKVQTAPAIARHGNAAISRSNSAATRFDFRIGIPTPAGV